MHLFGSLVAHGAWLRHDSESDRGVKCYKMCLSAFIWAFSFAVVVVNAVDPFLSHRFECPACQGSGEGSGDASGSATAI